MTAPRVVIGAAWRAKVRNGGERSSRAGWVAGFRALGAHVEIVEHLDGRLWARPGVDPRRELEHADLVVNLSGNLPTHRRSGHAPWVYVDLDPTFTQAWDASGLLGSELDDHDRLLTVATAIARTDCRIDSSRCWEGIVPPAAVEVLRTRPFPDEPGAAWHAVSTWRVAHGLPADHPWASAPGKHHAWMRIAELPRRVRNATRPPTLVVTAHRADRAGVDAMRRGGWRVQSTRRVASAAAYRELVAATRGEIGVAHGAYVSSRSGWLSDRTVAFLAAGRPAVVTDTGVTLPTGEGLLTFAADDVDGAAAAIDRVESQWSRHARLAREIAWEYARPEVTLQPMLELAGGRR